MLLLGNHLHPLTQVQGIGVVKEVNILGITVANNMMKDLQFQWNFQHKLTKIKTIYNTWWNPQLVSQKKGGPYQLSLDIDFTVSLYLYSNSYPGLHGIQGYNNGLSMESL